MDLGQIVAQEDELIAGLAALLAEPGLDEETRAHLDRQMEARRRFAAEFRLWIERRG